MTVTGAAEQIGGAGTDKLFCLQSIFTKKVSCSMKKLLKVWETGYLLNKKPLFTLLFTTKDSISTTILHTHDTNSQELTKRLWSFTLLWVFEAWHLVAVNNVILTAFACFNQNFFFFFFFPSFFLLVLLSITCHA